MPSVMPCTKLGLLSEFSVTNSAWESENTLDKLDKE